MNPIEARMAVYKIVREHNLSDELWLAFSMTLVNEAISKRTGSKVPLMPEQLKPELIQKRFLAEPDNIASDLSRGNPHQN